jgi:phosphatidylserine/phosphatidylglycerophosphate/cardiolipin synthase-like enzyme
MDPHSIGKLAKALSAGRIASPFSAFALGQVLGYGNFQSLADEMNALASESDPARLLGRCLEAVSAIAYRDSDPVFDLIWSGPDEPESLAESTQVRVDQLFRSAKSEVFVTGYALYKGRQIFESLAQRMAEVPELKVTLVMNIQRKENDTSLDEGVVARWKRLFFEREWPGPRKPEIYYDPRALLQDRSRRAVMHAKCIIIDQSEALVSSANLTEAAQCRNIEAGLLVRDGLLVRRLQKNFEVLIKKGHLRPV